MTESSAELSVSENIINSGDHVVGSSGPLSSDEAPGVQLIVQMRIYDALMGILTHLDAETAEALADLHRSGGILMSSPRLSGTFVDDNNQES